MVVHLDGQIWKASELAQGPGGFEFLGLPGGRVVLKPDAAELTGEAVVVELAEGSRLEDVEVEVYRPQWLEGRILGPYGPVPGAQVYGQPRTEQGSFHSYPDSVQRAEADGSFRFPWPRSAAAMAVAVFAPGFAARVVSFTDPASPVSVELQTEGGTLELQVQGAEARGEPPASTVVRAEGFSLPLNVFRFFWARMHEGERQWPEKLVLPMMSPGEYGLCHRPGGDPQSAAKCATGTLLPGGRLVLSTQ